MNKTSPYLLLVMLLGIFFTVNGESKVGKHNIGIGAGVVTGYGLSYRQWFDKNGFQVTMAPYYNEDEYVTQASLSLGVTALRTIQESDVVNLLVYFGPHLHLNYYDDNYSYSDYYKESSSDPDFEKNLFIGGGPGLDFHFWKVSFNIMAGYAFITNFEDRFGTQLTGEAALYYSF